MAITQINVGAVPDDGTGDPLRVAYQKINLNTTELVEQIATKADDAATTMALAGKANLSDMTVALAGKADAQTTEQALAQKANTADVQEALDLKANTADVDAALALKANALDVQNALAQMPGEAPDDGKQYARQNKAWTEVQSGGGTGTTNLGVANRTADTLDVTSSTGTAATLPSADEAQAGLMSAAQVQRLGGVGLQTVSVFDADPQNSAPVVQLRGGNMDTYDEGGLRWPHGTYNVDLIAPHDPAVMGDVEVSMPDETGTMATREWVTANFPSNKGQLFAYDWHNGPRSSIDSGCIPCDGQVLQYADNPVVCQAVWDGKQNAVLQENWAANKNCWGRGDGATWVQVPNLNMADGTEKPFYMRGGPESLNGTWVGDAIRNISGDFYTVFGNIFNGSLYQKQRDGNGLQLSGSSNSYGFVGLDASRQVPTADENRVKTAYGVWVVRVFTGVSNTGAIDAPQLATQLGVVDAALQTLDSQLGLTIVYPNGGTEATPATVALNTQYVMANPFPGHHVMCKAEVTTPAGIWVSTGWIFSGGGRGFSAEMRGVSQIVATVGSTFIAASSALEGGGSYATGDVPVIATAKTRVKVWKVKGGVA